MAKSYSHRHSVVLVLTLLFILPVTDGPPIPFNMDYCNVGAHGALHTVPDHIALQGLMQPCLFIEPPHTSLPLSVCEGDNVTLTMKIYMPHPWYADPAQQLMVLANFISVTGSSEHGHVYIQGTNTSGTNHLVHLRSDPNFAKEEGRYKVAFSLKMVESTYFVEYAISITNLGTVDDRLLCIKFEVEQKDAVYKRCEHSWFNVTHYSPTKKCGSNPKFADDGSPAHNRSDKNDACTCTTETSPSEEKCSLREVKSMFSEALEEISGKITHTNGNHDCVCEHPTTLALTKVILVMVVLLLFVAFAWVLSCISVVRQFTVRVLERIRNKIHSSPCFQPLSDFFESWECRCRTQQNSGEADADTEGDNTGGAEGDNTVTPVSSTADGATTGGAAAQGDITVATEDGVTGGAEGDIIVSGIADGATSGAEGDTSVVTADGAEGGIMLMLLPIESKSDQAAFPAIESQVTVRKQTSNQRWGSESSVEADGEGEPLMGDNNRQNCGHDSY